MNVLDLFSGIGGFSLGLEAAGMRTVAFCEIEPYPRAVLRKHWPDIPLYDDVRSLTANQLAADGIVPGVVCGGFPCQDISEAGKGKGLEGERSGLWRDFARLIEETRPRYAIIENSPRLRTNGLRQILCDLADVGYDAEWSIVSACSLGFPHTRERMFVVAYPQSGRREQCGRIKFPEGCNCERDVHQWFSKPEPARVAHGIPHRMDRNRAVGNAIVPQIAELIGTAIMRYETSLQ